MLLILCMLLASVVWRGMLGVVARTCKKKQKKNMKVAKLLRRYDGSLCII